jgi:Zn-dependent peptidase ImmA (M78 family)
VTKQEQQANRFAAISLVPEAEYKNLILNCPKPTIKCVRDFARNIGIAPGIVVGRLQHDKVISFSWLNELKVRFQLIENNP